LVPRKSKLTYRGTSRFPTKQIYNVPADKTYAGDKKGLQPTSVLAVFVDFSGACDSICRVKRIEKLIVNQRLKLIKRLARATWGNTQETMNTTYKTNVKPLKKYGSEVLVTASNSTLQALETTQNNALTQ